MKWLSAFPVYQHILSSPSRFHFLFDFLIAPYQRTEGSVHLFQKHLHNKTIFTTIFPVVLLTSSLKFSGQCTFESNQCQWTDTSEGQSRWQRQKSNNNTRPPTDHTTDTGDVLAFDWLENWWISWTQDKNLWVNILTITWPCTKLLSVHLNLHVCTVDLRCSRSFSGYYMSVNFSQESTQSEARLQSPLLPPSSPYCQIL